jgi:hypothetical protein
MLKSSLANFQALKVTLPIVSEFYRGFSSDCPGLLPRLGHVRFLMRFSS